MMSAIQILEWMGTVVSQLGTLNTSTTHVFEWAGTVLGLLGALLLATNSRISRYGWVAFLAANGAMIAFAYRINADGLLLQQLGFVGMSCLGLYRTGFLGSTEKRVERENK